MAYEFKKLSDVEVIAEPTETANVLIEENGIIKKAPKTAVGGGGSEADIIIVDDVGDIFLEKGSYADLVAAWNNGTLLNVDVVMYGEHNGENSAGYCGGIYKGYVANYYGEFNIGIVYINNPYGSFGYKTYKLYEDGSIDSYAGNLTTS